MEVMVSIIMMSYNHGKFIRQALESVLMQKTQYTYELLVGDDCSQDDTQAVVREMEPWFEGKMKTIFRQKNLGAQGNMTDLLSRTKGKYIAFLEGDDFWTDSGKLQKQVTFLETHPEYSACYHKNSKVDKDNNVLQEKMPDFPIVGDFTLAHYNAFALPGQTATVMARKEVMQYNEQKMPKVRHVPGDRILPLAAMRLGKVYCSDEVMSAYRSVVHSDRQSWSTKFGMDNPFGNYFFFCMRRDLERIGRWGKMNVDLKEADGAAFYNVLVHTFFWKQISFLPLTIFMLLVPSHRIYMLSTGGRQFWNEGMEKVKRKLHRS